MINIVVRDESQGAGDGEYVYILSHSAAPQV